MHSPTKVFGIGFQRTGTKTLGAALEILGYRVTGPNGHRDPKIRETVYQKAFGLVPKFDAFKDNPWPVLYRELDERYPGSKFVLTVRPTDAWIRSAVGHFGTVDRPMEAWIYGVGCPEGNEDVYVERYERHNREVIEYFAERPDDFLVLRVTEGEGWEKLCPFLGKDVPDVAFPFEDVKNPEFLTRKIAQHAAAADQPAAAKPPGDD
jgi:sulfotransferase family protein